MYCTITIYLQLLDVSKNWFGTEKVRNSYAQGFISSVAHPFHPFQFLFIAIIRNVAIYDHSLKKYFL